MRSFTKWAALFAAAIICVATTGSVSPAPLIDAVPADTLQFFAFAGATVGGSVMTLMDLAKGMDPNGKAARIIEMLHQTNPIAEDALFREGNSNLGHRLSVRTGLPSVYWRLLNQGTPPSKSTKVQVTESCGMLEALSPVDVKLVELSGDPAATRLNEAQAFLEAMNQEMASTMIYGNSSTSPEEFNGLAVRYSSLSAANAQNIIDGGGTQSDNCSMWLVGWGENKTFGIFPKGSQAGLKHTDMGEQLVDDESGITGRKMRAFVDFYNWDLGLCVADWRYTVRVCNIDVSTLVANSAPADLTLLLTKAWHRIPNFNGIRPVIYMNRTCAQYFDIQRQKLVKDGGGVTWENIDGKPKPFFRGIPIKTLDVLLETEARVT